MPDGGNQPQDGDTLACVLASPRAERSHNCDSVADLVAERVEKSRGRISAKRLLPIALAVAPEAVFTVRTWAIRAAYGPKLVPKSTPLTHQNHSSQTYPAAAAEILIKVRLHITCCTRSDGRHPLCVFQRGHPARSMLTHIDIQYREQ